MVAVKGQFYRGRYVRNSAQRHFETYPGVGLMEKLVLTEEELMVRESAADFLTEQAGPGALREIRDNANPLGYSADTWQQMIDLGWPAILVPEAHGGLGFSHAAMGQIMELSGNTLACSPLFATAIAGAITDVRTML